MMMKLLKTLFLLSCCLLSYFTYKLYRPAEEVASDLPSLEIPQFEVEKEQEEFHLYKKNQEDIELVVANQVESEKIKKLLNARGPASIKTRQREFLGQEFAMEDLRFTNSIDADWKEKLGADLLKFQAKETKTNIHSEKSFIQTDGKKNARFVEQVLITFFLTTGEQNSYHALVDSESGEVIKTWNKVIAEKKVKLPVY
jgi:hypothetical protein